MLATQMDFSSLVHQQSKITILTPVFISKCANEEDLKFCCT